MSDWKTHHQGAPGAVTLERGQFHNTSFPPLLISPGRPCFTLPMAWGLGLPQSEDTNWRPPNESPSVLKLLLFSLLFAVERL